MAMNSLKKIAATILWAAFFCFPGISHADVAPLTAQDWYSIRESVDETLTYTDPTTGETTTYTKGEWGGKTEGEGALDGCNPVGMNVIEASDCIFCPLFGVLYGAANQMSELSFSTLGKAIAMVMLIGFGLYIAFKTLAHVSSLTKQDAPKFLGELLTMGFKVMICYILLTNSKQIYDYFITPVLGAGLEFGSALLFSNPTGFQECSDAISQLDSTRDTALLPVSLFAKLDCFIRAIQKEIALTQAIGSSLMCVARHEAKSWGIWDFGMMFQGLIIWGFALMLSLAFAFYLIDATVMLGIVGALMPFLIACWPFKWTTGYTKKGIEMFLNTFFTYVFMGIVVSVNMQLIGQALTGGQTAEMASTDSSSGSSSSSSSSSVSSDVENGGLAEIQKALNDDDVKTLQKLTDIGFGGFLILLCCCIFGFKFTSQATTLAEKMSGGGGIGIGAQIGGMAAGGAATLAKKATQPARKAVVNKANELTNKAGNAIGKKLGLGRHGGKTGAKAGAAAMAAAGGGGESGGGGSGGGGSGGVSGGGGGNEGSANNQNKRPNRGTGPGGKKNSKKNPMKGKKQQKTLADVRKKNAKKKK